MAKDKTKDKSKAKVKTNTSIINNEIAVFVDEFTKIDSTIDTARNDPDKYDAMIKNDTFRKAMDGAKGFVNDHEYKLIDGGDKEVDEYLRIIFESKNLTTIDIEEFKQIILQEIHYGEYCCQIKWKKNDNDEFYPSKALGVKPHLYNYDKNGNLTTNMYGDNGVTIGIEKKLNPYEFIAVSDFANVGEIGKDALGRSNYENYLQIERLQEYIDQIASTGAIPRVIMSIPAADSGSGGKTKEEVDQANVRAVAENYTKLKSGSALGLVGVDISQIKEFATGDLGSIDSVDTKYKHIIQSNYYGNSKSYNPTGSGNNAEITEITKLNKKFVKKNVFILEKALNRLFRIITDVVFGFDRPSMTIQYQINEAPDSEKIKEYWNNGMKVYAVDLYKVLNLTNPYKDDLETIIYQENGVTKVWDGEEAEENDNKDDKIDEVE